jgi:hypothetical protein
MALKKYRVTIKQPKGKAEMSIVIDALTPEHAFVEGVRFARQCGEFVRDEKVDVKEIA